MSGVPTMPFSAPHLLVGQRAAHQVGAVGGKQHHPGLGLGERRRRGLGDIDRHLQIELALAPHARPPAQASR